VQPTQRSIISIVCWSPYELFTSVLVNVSLCANNAVENVAIHRSHSVRSVGLYFHMRLIFYVISYDWRFIVIVVVELVMIEVLSITASSIDGLCFTLLIDVLSIITRSLDGLCFILIDVLKQKAWKTCRLHLGYVVDRYDVVSSTAQTSENSAVGVVPYRFSQAKQIDATVLTEFNEVANLFSIDRTFKHPRAVIHRVERTPTDTSEGSDFAVNDQCKQTGSYWTWWPARWLRLRPKRIPARTEETAWSP